MNWDDLMKQGPGFRTVEGEIVKLTERTAHTITRMPHPTDPGYAARMREAYESTLTTVADIASDPDDINAGMRVGYLWAQVIDFTPFVSVDGEEFEGKISNFYRIPLTSNNFIMRFSFVLWDHQIGS